jgi:hypothetical protein
LRKLGFHLPYDPSTCPTNLLATPIRGCGYKPFRSSPSRCIGQHEGGRNIAAQFGGYLCELLPTFLVEFVGYSGEEKHRIVRV